MTEFTAADFAYMHREIKELRRQVGPLREAVEYGLPILEGAARGEAWSDEETAREAIRLGAKALTHQSTIKGATQ